MAKKRRPKRKPTTVRVEFLKHVSRHVQRIPGDTSSGVIQYWHEEGSIIDIDRTTARGMVAAGRVRIVEADEECQS